MKGSVRVKNKRKKKNEKKRSFRSSIKSKLVLISSLLLLISNVLIGTISYNVAKNQLEQSGKELLKNSVEMTLQYINENQSLVDQGKLTLEDAQEKVREYMLGKKDAEGKRPINKNIHLGENGYLLAYTQEGIEAVHPSLEGKNVWEAKDKKDGSYLVQEQISVANNGGGFLEYWWTLPSSEKIAPKITYQKTDPNWKWVISAGTYMNDFNKGSYKILYAMLIVLGVIFVLGEVLIIMFSNKISSPIGKINEAVKEVSAGNLNIHDVNITNNDETGELSKSFNLMLKNIRQLINSVKASANTVTDSSKRLEEIVGTTIESVNEVAVAVDDVAKVASGQAQETENGVIYIKNLAEQIESVNKITSDTSNDAAIAAELSRKGLDSVNILTSKSKKNNEAALKANEIILEVDKNSEEISSITETISQIAEQTNLLALNAAIEAARAGEQGKGFAVVAEEVRKLAAESSMAVTKVKELIDGIQIKSKTAVEAMEQGKKVAAEQDNAVVDVKNIFQNISDSIRKMAENIGKINEKSLTMSKEKEDVVEMLEQLSASTEESSATTEEVAASTEHQLLAMEEVSVHTEELKELAEKLQNEINKFNMQ